MKNIIEKECYIFSLYAVGHPWGRLSLLWRPWLWRPQRNIQPLNNVERRQDPCVWSEGRIELGAGTGGF